MGEMKEQLAANERKLREANAAMQADMESMAKRMEASNSKLAQLADEAGDTKVIPTPSHVLGRISPIFSPLFPVFCAFSPSCRGGSNEPQARTQGQETAGRPARRLILAVRRRDALGCCGPRNLFGSQSYQSPQPAPSRCTSCCLRQQLL